MLKQLLHTPHRNGAITNQGTIYDDTIRLPKDSGKEIYAGLYPSQDNMTL